MPATESQARPLTKSEPIENIGMGTIVPKTETQARPLTKIEPERE